MTDRISTFTQTNRLIENNLRLQGKYSEGQLQIASGDKSQSYEGIAKDSKRLLSFQSDYKRLEAQTNNAETAQSRMDHMYDSLGTVIDFSMQFAADLTAAISNVVNNTTHIQNTSQQLLEQTASVFNTQMAGRYLFAGSATRTEPVDINAVGYGGAVIPSAANTAYYQGNGDIQNVEIDDNYTVNYGVTADNPAIEKIMRAYDLVRTTPGDQATLSEATQLLNEGVDELAEVRSALSQSSSGVDRKIEDNKKEMLLLKNLIEGLNKSDVAEVSIRMQELELHIEASLSVTTKMINLSIIDYLR